MITFAGSIAIYYFKNIAILIMLVYLWVLVIKENKRYNLKERVERIIKQTPWKNFQKIVNYYKKRNPIQGGNKWKTRSGITLVILTITIVIMIIIAGTVITIGIKNLNAKNLKNLYADLKSLNDKISVYYNQYGTLPIKEKFMGSYTFTSVANPNDDVECYYIIDVNKLKNLILTKKITWTENDVYIINTKTHMVYYPEGVTLDGEIYYRLPGEYSELYQL